MSIFISEKDQLVKDIFTTAIEGGVNYWADTLKYQHSIEDYYALLADLEDGEPGEQPKRYTVTQATIERGLAIMAKREGLNPGSDAWRCGDMALKLRLGRNLDDLDFDAADADMIVQAGLFGEIVYG